MTRLLWLFFIMDVVVVAMVLANGASLAGGPDIWLRVTIELAALAVIYEIRKVGK